MTNRDRWNVKFHRFTLVEVLMVITIIASLAAVGVGVVNFTRNKVTETNTITLITRLNSAFEQLHGQFGVYPKSNEDGVIKIPQDAVLKNSDKLDLSKLTTDKDSPLYGLSDKYRDEFIRLLDLQNLVLKNSQLIDDYYVLVDSWGRPLFYRAPGAFHAQSFDLCSAGRDGNAFYEKIYDFDNQESAKIIAPVWDKMDNDKLASSRDQDVATAGSTAESANKNAKLFFSSEYGDDITNY